MSNNLPDGTTEADIDRSQGDLFTETEDERLKRADREYEQILEVAMSERITVAEAVGRRYGL